MNGSRQKEDSLAANSRTEGSRKTSTGGNPSRLREKTSRQQMDTDAQRIRKMVIKSGP
jgi:hypothetical protein